MTHRPDVYILAGDEGKGDTVQIREIPLTRVKIPEKRMRALRGVESLAQSIKGDGLLNPITVRPLLDSEYVLVAGLHRLKATEMLGHETIACNVRQINDLNAELIEIDENLEQNSLTQVERVMHVKRRHQIWEAMGLRKSGPRGGRPRKDNSANFAQLQSGPEFAEATGMKTRTMYLNVQIGNGIPDPILEMLKQTNIVDNQQELRRFSRKTIKEQVRILVQLRSGLAKGVREAEREHQRALTARLARNVEIPTLEQKEQRFKTILLDPPWANSVSGDIDPFGKLNPAYKAMTYEEIEALPIPDLADEEDCHLYLWVTSRTPQAGYRLLDHWGFRPMQQLIWVKDRRGTGRYYANEHEVVLFAMRGTRLLATKQDTTVFYGPRGKHSEKPDSFYEIIDRNEPKPVLDMFARKSRPGYVSWGTLEDELLKSSEPGTPAASRAATLAVTTAQALQALDREVKAV